MNEDDIFRQTSDAYLCLIHPVRRDDKYRAEVAGAVALAPSLPDELIAAMLTGAGWRERLLGLCLAVAKQPSTFLAAMVQSLHNPRGIVIVPTCAALAVLARRGVFQMAGSFAETFNRAAFDGEVGWAADKAMHHAGLRADDVPDRGPNYGQVFEDHVALYGWVQAA